MNSEQIFMSALDYERKIRDLYLSAVETIDSERGKKIFNSLAKDEQSHVDFLEHSMEILKSDGRIDPAALESAIPPKDLYAGRIEKMQESVPDQMLGDVKRVLSAALKLEIETSEFYEGACSKTEGVIKEVFQKLLEIERRHEDVVQMELDHVSNNGYWFDFMEIDLEHG